MDQSAIKDNNMVLSVDIYFWRQSIVLLADVFHSVAIGFILSFPSVLNPAIMSPNATDIRVTKNEASWITSIYGFAGVIGFSLIPAIMQMFGRKIVHIILNALGAVGFIMLALAKDVTTLYLARSIQGLGICGVYLTNIILAEYASPKRRGYFITFKKSSVAFGSLLCHSIVLVCSWKQIAGIATIFSLLAIVLTFPWPESPAYLAMKGRLAECDKSYMYLNGDTLKNRKELDNLIAAQLERRKIADDKARRENKLLRIAKKFTRKDFLKPFFIITMLTVIIDSGGRYYNLTYIVQIIKDITGDNSLGIYCSIGLDILTMVACWASSYVITKFARRTLLFTFGYSSVILMFLISLIVYLKANIAGVVWLTPCIILFNSFIFNLGVVPICFTVSGEVFPLEHRGTGVTATGIIFTLLFAITLKFTPMMMEKTGIEGTYGIYGLCLFLCLVILNFILTETKDKTLQEIEDEIKGIERNTVTLHERELLPTVRIDSRANEH